MRLILTLLAIIIFVPEVTGQKDTLKQKKDSLPDRFFLLQKVKRDGVTMPEIEIKEVTVIARPRMEKRSEYRKYERLVSNIKRVYPYALLVRRKLTEVNENIKNMTSEKERKELHQNCGKGCIC